MASTFRRLFVPLGELKPDRREFSNDGLVTANGVVPVYGNYVTAHVWSPAGDSISEGTPDAPWGMHVHFGADTTWYVMVGTNLKLYQYSNSFVATDKTRSAGGDYGTSPSGAGWQGTSFGDAVVMTNYNDDVQYLATPATANFTKLAQSGGGNPGMDPKARFVAPVRNNLFLANLNLSTGFDGLASGVNPTAVCWSQSDNIRQYGSFNVTPQLIGSGYQPLNYDLGYITGMIGGDYAIIMLHKGIVRCDGPPYSFRPIVEGVGCIFPNSIVRLGSDVYFWGPAGPTVLAGGEGPPVILGDGKIARTLIDNSTGFSPASSLSTSVAVRHVSAAADAANGLVYWAYTSSGADGRLGDLCVIYNTREDRFSFMDNGAIYTTDSGPFNTGIVALKTAPNVASRSWAPGRDLVGMFKQTPFAGDDFYQLAVPSYESPTPPNQWGGASPVLTRGFQQFESDYTTRVRRVRPVYARSGGSTTLLSSVSVASKNKPFESASATSFTQSDGSGWITTPTAKFADFHQVGMVFSGVVELVEIEGFEVEYEIGGQYGA